MATTYTNGTYSGVELHIITTSASNIQLINQRIGPMPGDPTGMSNMRNSDYFGINGAWFNNDYRILNIAINDGKRVGPTWGQNGCYESHGNSVGSGAVKWNGTQLSCYADVAYDTDISGWSNNGVWIQGGIALWLGYSNWATKFKNQKAAAQYFGSSTGKTAFIANMSTQKVHLIVTEDNVTTTAFRSAIQAYLGISDGVQANNSVQGIMLDGSGSSQMKAKNGNTTVFVDGHDGRALPQIIALKSWA